MNTYKHKIAFIIPTKDRPEDLGNLLSSLQAQTYKPDQLIVVDGGSETVEGLTSNCDNLSIKYLRVYPPGLTKQRNAGVKALRSDITLVGFLDDDLTLEKDALEQMLKYWETASPEIGGSSFNLYHNVAPKPPNRFKTIFHRLFVTGGEKGKILRSGCNTILSPVYEDTYVEWLSGGATVWKREIINNYKFDEWFAGYGHYDDVDFSYTVSHCYKLIVLSKAKANHYMRPINKKKYYIFCKGDIINRFYFVKKHHFPLPCFYTAALGQITNYLFRVIFTNERADILKVLGNMAGLFCVLRGDLDRNNRDIK